MRYIVIALLCSINLCYTSDSDQDTPLEKRARKISEQTTAYRWPLNITNIKFASIPKLILDNSKDGKLTEKQHQAYLFLNDIETLLKKSNKTSMDRYIEHIVNHYEQNIETIQCPYTLKIIHE